MKLSIVGNPVGLVFWKQDRLWVSDNGSVEMSK